jgi:succinate dehydrogenase / fumarate reductase membrane anchor subunit
VANGVAMSGFSAWLVQRLSAVYMAVFIFVVFAWLIILPLNAENWLLWMGNFWIQLAVLLFYLSLLLHAWIGIRDVIMDYVHPLGLRVAAFALLGLFLLANGFWIMKVLWVST